MRIVVKIFLIIALACSGATIALLIAKVEPRVKKAEADRDKNGQDRDAEAKAKADALAQLETTKGELQTTQASLQATQTELASTKQAADAAQQALQKESSDHSKVKAELARWKSDHDEFVQLGRTPDQIKKTEADLKKTTAERDTLDKENKMLSLKVNTLTSQNIKLREALYGTNIVVLPKGLAGKVAAVDPKYQFVVLDIGERQGAMPKGEMVVTREGKLIGKVRIAETGTDHSVCNVLKEWSQKGTEIMEGDVVLADYKL